MKANIPFLAFALSLMAQASGLSAEISRRMRIFDTGTIVSMPRSPAASLPPLPMMRGLGFMGSEFDQGGAGAAKFSGMNRLDKSLLSEAITGFIAEDSWRNSRNRLDWAEDGNRLIVVQTPEILDQIERFLRILEARAARRVCLDLALVPPAALDAASPGWSRPGASPWLDGAVLDLAVKASAGAASVFSIPAHLGVERRTVPNTASLHLPDYEVNQTGMIPVEDPVVSIVQEGAFSEGLVLGSPGGNWFRVDLRLGRTSLPEKGERRKLDQREVELLVKREEHIGTSLIVPQGRAVVLGAIQAQEPEEGQRKGARPESFVGLLRVEPVPGEAPPASGADLPMVLDTGLLTEPSPDFSLPSSPDSRYDLQVPDQTPQREFPPPISSDLFEDSLRSLIPGEIRPKAEIRLAGGTAILSAPGADENQVRASLDGLARDRLQLLEIDLWQGILAGDDLAALGKSGAILDDSWLDRMEKAPGLRARIIGLGGVPVSLASVLSRNYLGDLEKVSGGTSKSQILESGDPVVDRAGEGLILTVIAEPVPGAPWVQLRLRGECAGPPSFKRRAMVRITSEIIAKAEAEKKPGMKTAGDWLTLDLPEEDSERWEHLVTVPLKRPAFLNALPDRSRPGRTRALIVTVNRFSIEAAP